MTKHTWGMLLIWSLFVQLEPVRASVYHVATNGADTASGLDPAHAWRTVQHAVDAVGPGDTIIVLPGTYAGARINYSGTSTAPITLRAQSNARVILDSVSPSALHNSILELESALDTPPADGVVRHWVIEGFHIHHSPKYGIDARSTQFLTFRGNTVSNAFVTGIFTAFSYDLLIEGNACMNNHEHGIYVSNSGDRFIVRGNHVYHNDNAGIHLNGDASVPPPDNSPWAGDGILSDGIIENNIVHENGRGGAGINMDGVVRTVVRNNILYRTSNNSGIALYGIDGAVGSRENWVVNNVIIMGPDAGWGINLTHSDCVSNKVFNNIIFHAASADGDIVIPEPGLAGFECDYNSVKGRFSASGDNSRIGLTDWRAMGFDSNSVVETPDNLFADNSARDYRLRPASPAIDAGRPHPSAPLDRAGTPRPLDGDGDGTAGWDMGAFEYVHETADSDGDRMGDAAELHAGTDPLDSSSVLRITAFRSGASSAVSIAWTSVTGMHYRVLGTEGTGFGFVPVTNAIVATPPTNTLEGIVPASSSRIYRVGIDSP